MSRSTSTPDPQHLARALSPCPTPIGQGRVSTSEKRGTASSNSFIGVSSGTIREPSELVAAFSGMNLATNGGADEESHFPSQVEQDVDSHQNYLFGLQGGRNHLKQNTYMKNSESGHFMSSVPPSAILSVKGKYTIFPIFFYHMFYTQISCQNVLV